jgi:hypothetical protein
VIACIRADSIALPPGIIYGDSDGGIRSSWAEAIEAGEHQVSVTSTLSGWSNNDVGLAWLKEIFDRYTKQRAGNEMRLLIFDGHGSHITSDFIDYCDENKILLMVLPAHSTHSLQPLDVVMFKALSTAYTTELTNHLHRSQGLLPIKKSDFFLLFWRAWESSFRKDLILKAFESTGIYPPDASAVLKRFQNDPPTSTTPSPVPSNDDWRELDRLICSNTIYSGQSPDERRIRSTAHHLKVHHDLMATENEGLRSALLTKAAHQKASKPLPLQRRENYYGGAHWYSPRSLRHARLQLQATEQEKDKIELQKAEEKAARLASRLTNQKLQEARREQRERAKEEREEERADKAAQTRRRKEENAATNSQQLSQSSKRKASRTTLPKQKRQKRSGRGAASNTVLREPSPPPTQKTSRGRKVLPPARYR